MKKAILWKPLEKGVVECQACNFRCKISLGMLGNCRVRKNVDGELFSLVYGEISSVNIDPIEKKPLFHFHPGIKTYSIGTIGCNFKCLFCQNYDISTAEPDENNYFGKEITPEEVVANAKKYDCKAIAYTYNEPSIFIEFVIDTAKIAKKEGIKNVYVTNGYESKEALEKLKGLVDAMNIDLKSMSDEFYMKVCGAVKIENVLETIALAHKMGFWIELTTLVIPGHNDSEKELKETAKFIAGLDKSIPWHISRFFPMHKMENVPPTPVETLMKAYKIGIDAGLKYVYVGNLDDNEHENTICPKCGELVIERDWRRGIMNIKLKKNKCPKCGEEIAGFF